MWASRSVLISEGIMSKKTAKDTVSSANARIVIEEQTAAFLKSGGSIQQIVKGASGQVSLVGTKKTEGKK